MSPTSQEPQHWFKKLCENSRRLCVALGQGHKLIQYTIKSESEQFPEFLSNITEKYASLRSKDAKKQFSFIREMADFNVSILNFFFSISLFMSFKFKIMRYEPSFFLTHKYVRNNLSLNILDLMNNFFV